MSEEAQRLQRQAFAHFAAGRLTDAIADYRRAVAADPDFALAWNGLSQALRRSGDLAGAIEAAQRLAELEAEEPLSHSNLSLLYRAQGRVPEAEAAMARAVELEAKGRR